MGKWLQLVIKRATVSQNGNRSKSNQNLTESALTQNSSGALHSLKGVKVLYWYYAVRHSVQSCMALGSFHWLAFCRSAFRHVPLGQVLKSSPEIQVQVRYGCHATIKTGVKSPLTPIPIDTVNHPVTKISKITLTLTLNPNPNQTLTLYFIKLNLKITA